MAKFVLEVLGGAGAIWGSSEALTLRTADNSATLWRPIAAAVGGLFFLRWCCQVCREIQAMCRRDQDDNEDEKESARLMQSTSEEPHALYHEKKKKYSSLYDLEMTEIA